MFVEINSQRIPLDIGQLYLLGKQINGHENKANNFIKLEEAEDIEHRHCIIEVGHSEDVYVFDLFSSKGTLVNNEPLKGLEKLRLKNGDILKVGQQEVKYFHDQQEESHDSSGFLEVNKNTSDIIASSPDSTSQHESRIKRANNYNNFLVPSIPAKKSMTPNKSLVIPETEINTSRNSLNSSSNSLSTSNRRSDSFTIPETQYCKPRGSLNASDISMAESNPNESGNKIKFNFGNIDLDNDEEDDFCIPETQEVLPAAGISSSQRPRILSDAKEKESTNEAEDSNDIEGSQFRICTQDYNEGFGEEADAGLHSQIIPMIKHNTVILNNSAKSCHENSKNQSKIEEEDKEMSALKWNNSKVDQETTALRADCSTPDIFDFEGLQQESTKPTEDVGANKQTIVAQTNLLEEDEEDLLPTQRFLPSATTKPLEKKVANSQEKDCLEKENEEVLTLSDKENRCPVTLEPITDLPPTQLFEAIEVPTARSTNSSASRNSLTTPTVEAKNNSKSLLNIEPDDEDDLLTQAFLQPTNLPSSSGPKNLPVKYFNSTVLEDKFMCKNPATFFAEMEKTTLKQISSPAANFKLPERDFSALRKTSSTTSSTSETDLDLLMCTPQLIKEHMNVDKTVDLRRNILAVKNKHLFGDDTDDEEETEVDDEQGDLVKLINIPKDSLDFDKLLPHLVNKQQRSKAEKEVQAAKEAQKIYKFNISFGKEHEHENQSKSSHFSSSTLSRDERHAARDKERDLAERKGQTKAKENSSNRGKKQQKDPQQQTETAKSSKQQDEQQKSSKTQQKKPKQTTASTEQRDEEKSSNKPEKTTRQRKRQASSDKTVNAKESIKEDPVKLMPGRRMTRAKSKYEETPSTSKAVAASSKSAKSQQPEEDELDYIATQPFVRLTRCRSNSKQSESQDSITSNSSLRKSAQHNKSKNDTSMSHNVSVNGNMATKTAGERKRKAEAEATPPVVPAKVERKRLRSTHSQESSTATNPSTSSAVVISMTMVDQELFKKLGQNSKGLWSIAKNPADSEVLVMDKAFRTFKFLLAMARGIPIVTSEYLKKLNAAPSGKKVRMKDYLFVDAEFEKKHKFSLVKSLQMAKKHKLFKGYEFVMTANILPNPQEIKAIIEVSGGQVYKKTPPAPKENQNIYLVTAKEDKKEWHKYRRLNKNIIIVSTEAVMSAVMRQTCECMTSYTLS